MAIRVPFLLVPIAVISLVGAACSSNAAAPAAPTAKSSAPAAATSAPASSGAAAKAGNAAKGKELFSQTCVSCHGPEAKGLPGLGKDLTKSAFITGQNDDQMVEFIKKGRPATDPANTTHVDMPPKGGNPALDDAKLRDIVAFLRTLQ